jgi:hypothetical protein
MEHTVNTLCEQNSEPFNIKACGTCNYHCISEGYQEYNFHKCVSFEHKNIC